MERFVFISGDVHLGEIQVLKKPDAPAMRQNNSGGDEADAQCGEPANHRETFGPAVSPLDIDLVDATSSGLTHSVGAVMPEWLFDFILPSSRRQGRFLRENFGSLTVALNNSEPILVIAIHRITDGAPVIVRSIAMEDLSIGREYSAECGMDDCHIAATSTWLKRLLFSVQAFVFPSLKMHRVIYIIVWAATAALGLLCLLILALCYWCCFSRNRKRKLD